MQMHDDFFEFDCYCAVNIVAQPRIVGVLVIELHIAK